MENTLEKDLHLSVCLARAVHQDALADAAHRALWRELVYQNRVVREARATGNAKALAAAGEDVWHEMAIYGLSVAPPCSDAAAEARVAILALGLDLWMQAGNWTGPGDTAIDGVNEAFRAWRGEPGAAAKYDPAPEEEA